MKPYPIRILQPLAVAAALAAVSASLHGAEAVTEVNPFIGTAGHGHVYPGATVPFGMVQLSPDTRTDTWDGCSGYHYSDTHVLGFSHNHLSGTGIGDLGNVLLMPTTGTLHLNPGTDSEAGYRTSFSHDQEEARPGYYRVYLPEYKVNVELTATTRAGMHCYTFPQSDEGHVILDLVHGLANQPVESVLSIENDREISGYRKSKGWGGEKVYYYVIEFSRPFDATSGIQRDGTEVGVKEAKGKELRAHFDFKTKDGEKILARVGLSTVSVEGAKRNLRAEMPEWDFKAVVSAAQAQWEKALGAVKIQTSDKNVRQTFYTALYHTQLAPTILSDVDGKFRGPDRNVHEAKGFDYYTEFSLWDTFRAEHPLLTLVQPQRVNDFVRTMLAHFTIYGKQALPVWTEGGLENWCMIGNHSIPVIVDAYLKGFRDWDASEALDDMVATTATDRANQDSYRTLGYIAPGKKVQSVSKVLEYAYDDACISRFARVLGKKAIAEIHAKRAGSWQNVFDPATSLMRGKTADGKWVTPFLPTKLDKLYYTEANAWQYTFFVPHDVAGLSKAMGGDDKFTAHLNELFDSKEKIPNSLNDVTGLIGQYSHGNEPCHNVAYLYNYAGQPWKTQERTHHIAATLYNNTPEGLCGNDDCGQMSAWYVFTAMGFYPVDPVSGVYVIGSPLVDKVTLDLDGKHYKGVHFTVTAKNHLPANIYIQSAELNGKPMSRSWIRHDEISAGGELVLTMGPNPNENWGRKQADRPGAPADP
ncbi:MAG: putative alpha,2-mannosidase [Akkermansiaceae bacterium]|nr:putative alpha,2-mannosidase [Akkermansiaceae bacterium]